MSGSRSWRGWPSCSIARSRFRRGYSATVGLQKAYHRRATSRLQDAPDGNGRGRAGRATRGAGGDGAVRRIRVEVVDPPRRLVFRWWPYEREGARRGMGTRVEFLLQDRGDGSTALMVAESGWLGFLRSPRPTAEVSA